MKDAHGKIIRAGDRIMIDAQFEGLVIADFDAKCFIPGEEHWGDNAEQVGDGRPTRGIMVRTQAFGLIHYPCDDEEITLHPASS